MKMAHSYMSNFLRIKNLNLSQNENKTESHPLKSIDKIRNMNYISDKCDDSFTEIEKLNQKLNKYESKKSEIKKNFSEIKRNIDEEKLKLSEEINSKEDKSNNLKNNIISLTNQIKELNFKLENTKETNKLLISKKKEKYLGKLKKNKNYIKEIRKKYLILPYERKEEIENFRMLEEELDLSRREIINITSKMESIVEFINSELNKNSFPSEVHSSRLRFPKVNVTLIEFKLINKQKFAEELYNRLNNCKNQANFEIFASSLKQIYLQLYPDNGTLELISKIANHIIILFKNSEFGIDLHVLIRYCIKICYYDFILSLRMSEVNKLNHELVQYTTNNIFLSNNMNNINNKNQIEKLSIKLDHKERKVKKLIKKITDIQEQENVIEKEDMINRENISKIQIEIESMKCIQENIKCEINLAYSLNKELSNKYEDEFSFKKENCDNINSKISKIKSKIEILQNSNNYLIKQTNLQTKDYIKKRNEVKNYLTDKEPKTYTNTGLGKIDKPENSSKLNNPLTLSPYVTRMEIPKNKLHTRNELKINTITQNEFLISEKLRPLTEGSVIYKRNFCNIILNKIRVRKQHYIDALQYNPIINNKLTQPEEFSFKKFFLQADKSRSQLIFNKIGDTDKTNEIYISSISKLVIPKVTKDIIFLYQIGKKFLRGKADKNRLNYDTNEINSINNYLENNIDKLIKLYYKKFQSESNELEINEKLLNSEYRQLLLKANKFIIYLYLKPDDETRIEIIYESYEDFKQWINGLEFLLKNKNGQL